MNTRVKIQLIKLQIARNNNKISQEQFEYLVHMAIRSNGNFRPPRKYFEPNHTHRAYPKTQTQELSVVRILWLLAIIAAFVMGIVSFFGDDNVKIRDYSYCDALERKECKNGGYLVQTKAKGVFTCQCQGNFYGEHCADEKDLDTYFQLFWDALFGSEKEDERRGAPQPWWWSPFTDSSERQQHTAVITFHQNHVKRLMGERDPADVGENDIADFGRILPPSRPLYCQVDESLPPLNALYEKVFKRDVDGRLREDPKKRNLLYRAFYQFFVLQFFGKEFSSTVTGSQLYGYDAAAQKNLRSMVDGKLKTEYLNGEHYPSRLSFAEKIKKVFTRTPMVEQVLWFNRVATDNREPRNRMWSVFTDVYEAISPRWSVTNPMLSADPLLFAMSTFWLREHNRLCDELKSRWPEWKDNRLYAVAKNTVVAQMMGIMMNDVLSATSPTPLKYDPESYRDQVLNTNSGLEMPLEMLLTTVLPSGLPEGTHFGHESADDKSQVLPSSMRDMVRHMVDQRMGSLTSNNDGVATMPITKTLLKLTRENKVKSFNDYRRHFGLQAYKSFFELAGNNETAYKLNSLYQHVDDVELLTGVLTEKQSEDVVPTFTDTINSVMINSIVTNPLNGKDMWHANTFGGKYFFNLVKSANIRTFICNNLGDKCDDDFIVDIFAK